MSQLRYWIWLTTIPGVSLRSQTMLLERFHAPEEIFMADCDALEEVPNVTKAERAALGKRDLRLADQILEDCQKNNYGIVTIQDAAYPQRLRDVEFPPLVLYYKGTFLPFDQLPSIAVVGARKASGYGLVSAKRLGMQIAACGGVVISGAAKGIDSMALEGALSTGAPVAAVLGNGLDIIYPYEAKRIYEDVASRGCLISEYPPGTKPLGVNFPRRNRIMSGLSLGVLVVEAAKRSGSLITAEFALEQGRDVYAVPGNIGLACCEGSNALIRDGADLVTCGWDVMQGYLARFPQRIRHWEGGKQLTLSPQDRKYLHTEEAQSAVKELPVLSAEPQENAVQSESAPTMKSEKRIDNEEKRNYSDLQRLYDSLTEDEQALVRILQQGQKFVDDIIMESGIPAARVLASLTLLEVKGFVVQQPGKRFDLIISN